jgi:hypothetical protein
MRGAALFVACAASLAVGCGSNGDGQKTEGGLDGPRGTGGGLGRGGVIGTGGGPGAGGVTGTAGSMGTGGRGAGGALGTGGATGVDAGPARDTGRDGTATRREADGERGGAETLDVAIEAAGGDGATSLDLGELDTSTDKPGSETAAPGCAAAGGTCSPSRWEICPKRYEPIDQGTGHVDCPIDGWCCVPAPSSPCSDQGAGNCVVGDSCTGCWAPAPGTPACESGRVCCVDMCN